MIASAPAGRDRIGVLAGFVRTMRHVGAMFSDSLVPFLLMNLAFILIGILITWLVIYSAVRAALASHRQAMARDGRLGQV